jgi:phosphoglycolate phosphatase
MIGDGARVLVARALGADAANAALLERTLSAFLEAYALAPCAHTTLLPGAREALALALPRALVTNKPRSITMLILEGLGLADAFGAIYAGGDGPLKPNPNGVLVTAAQLGVPATTVWLVGDGPQDVLAGHAAGCFTIAVPGIAAREDVLAANPDLVVESLLDVALLVRGL